LSHLLFIIIITFTLKYTTDMC